MDRTVNPWRDILQLGYHGNPLMATCPRNFSTQRPPRRSQPLHGGLRRTQSPLITTSLHHMIRWSLSLWAVGWPSGPFGLHSFRIGIPTCLLISLTVHTRFRHMNNLATQFRTCSLAMRNRSLYFYCLLSAHFLTMYTGLKRSKLITHTGHNHPSRVPRRTRSATRTMLERQKTLSATMGPLLEIMRLSKGM